MALSVPSGASAQGNARSFVSALGNDANACTRAAPCRTFAGAYQQTLAGGEINCLDAADFSRITITKSITIDCTGQLGGITHTNGSNAAIYVSTAASDRVILRGLVLSGANSGGAAISFTASGSLIIDRVNMSGFASYSVVASSDGTVAIQLSDCTLAGASTNIFLAPQGASATMRVAISNTRILNSGVTGIDIETRDATGPGVGLTMDGGIIDVGRFGIQVDAPNGGYSGAAVLLNGVTISNQTAAGIFARYENALVRVSGSTVIGNGVGIQPRLGATIASFGNNRVYGNSDNGTFTGSLTGQ